MKTDKEKQDKINSQIRYIAYNVFSAKGDYKFVNAYEKLKSRVLLDHKIHINNRIKDSRIENAGIFDVVSSQEIDLILRSSIALVNMYEEVKIRKAS